MFPSSLIDAFPALALPLLSSAGAAPPSEVGSFLDGAGAWFSSLNWIDYVLLLGLVSGLFVGIGVGFYRQVAIFISMAVGLFAAAQLAEPLLKSPNFAPVCDTLGPHWSHVAAFAFVLWAALVVGLICCLVFHSFFGRTLRVADGALGGVMGMAISAVFFGLVLLGVFHHDQSQRFDEPIRSSRIGVQLAEGARVFSRFFPDDIQQRFDRALEREPVREEPARTDG